MAMISSRYSILTFMEAVKYLVSEVRVPHLKSILVASDKG